MIEETPQSETPPTPDLSIYKSVVENQTELICRRTPDGTITFVNDAYCEYFGFSRKELIGFKFMPLIPEEDRRKIEQISAGLSPENPAVAYEHRTLSKQPDPIWLQWVKRAIYNEQGALVEYQFVGRDVTEHKKAEEEMRFLSTHDPLTRLFNLAFFHTEMERLERGRMFPISILLCLAEEVNPQAGARNTFARDRIYEQTAQMLRCAFRAEDIIARIQEGLFGVLLPFTGSAVANQGKERLAKFLETQKQLEGNTDYVFRLGLATGEKGAPLLDLLRQAEQDLLDAHPI